MRISTAPEHRDSPYWTSGGLPELVASSYAGSYLLYGDFEPAKAQAKAISVRVALRMTSAIADGDLYAAFGSLWVDLRPISAEIPPEQVWDDLRVAQMCLTEALNDNPHPAGRRLCNLIAVQASASGLSELLGFSSPCLQRCKQPANLFA